MKNKQNNLKILSFGVVFSMMAAMLSNAIFADASFTPVIQGGTGVQSLQVFAPIIGGATQTAAVNQVALSTSGYVLTSTGTSSAPTFKVNSALGGVTTISNSDGS